MPQPDEAMHVLKEKASQLNVSTFYHVLTSMSKSDKSVLLGASTNKNVNLLMSLA